jgi:hypothetical protein
LAVSALTVVLTATIGLSYRVKNRSIPEACRTLDDSRVTNLDFQFYLSTVSVIGEPRNGDLNAERMCTSYRGASLEFSDATRRWN